MKSVVLILSLLFLQISLYSQHQQKPMPDQIFVQELNRMKAVRQEQKRLSMAIEFGRRNNLLTRQAKQVTLLFGVDLLRLDFLQNAYAGIYDKENTYDLYDSFNSFSTVMRFHDFLEQQSLRPQNPVKNRYDLDRKYSFPEYNYPSHSNYHNYSPCERPLSEEDFDRFTDEILSYRDDETRVQVAVRIAEANCMTVSQVMKMGSMIQKEQKRLEYIKRTYDHTFDLDNFSYNNQLFKESNYRTEFDNFVKERRNKRDGRKPEINRCRVSDNEMADIVASIKQQSFDNTRLESAKQIIRAKQCFTVLQIKQVVEIFSFENTRLELAKMCYDYCVDQSDYYKLNNSFTFSRSVDELNKYIQDKQK